MADEKKSAIPFDPAGAIESAFLLGIGMFELTKEKTQELTSDLIEKGKLSQSDAKKVADKIGEIAEEQQDSMRKVVADETHKVLKTSGLATKEEVAEIKSDLAEIKKMLAASAKKGAAGS